MGNTSIVELCQVAPSSGASPELFLPLLYTDITFLSQNPIEIVLFYSLPCSESHFLDTIVPKLKNSLSLTLKRFTPFAGKIIFPLTSDTMPAIHYVNGDSVSLTIALSDTDFNLHSGYVSRNSDQLRDFVPPFPPATYLSDFIKFSVAATQVTLFPNQGICIGITQHHAIGDGTTNVQFMNMWASITKLNGHDLHLSTSKYRPFYDRSGFQDAYSLTTTYWNLVKMQRPVVSSCNSLPTSNRLRATFVLSGDHIAKLKKYILSKKTSMSSRLSSFTVICAHLWTSLARSEKVLDDDDDKPEYFHFTIDCRGRLNPPLPDTYFGNCLAHVLVESTHERLKGDHGIVVAAEAITEAIQKAINHENGILNGYVKHTLQVIKCITVKGNRVLTITGSPRLDWYGVDFGLGRPKKSEIVYLDFGCVWLTRSREFQGGVEMVLMKSKVKMDAFADSFSHGLKEATQNTYADDHLSRL